LAQFSICAQTPPPNSRASSPINSDDAQKKDWDNPQRAQIKRMVRAQPEPKPGKSLTHGICAVHLFGQVFAVGLDREAAQRNRPEELRSKFRPKIF